MKLYRTPESDEEKEEQFLAGNIPVAVYGLGKMGLPVAARFADVCGNVLGVDIDPHVVETVKSGRAPFNHEPDLDELIEASVESDRLRPTTDSKKAASEAAVHIIIVPTLVTEENQPDLSVLRSVLRDITTGIEEGDMVIVESTVPPRTCEDVVQPLVEKHSNLASGEFGVAFCPERTHSGRALRDIRRWPKVVGGVDDESTRVAELIYENITENEIVPVADSTTAEAVKVFTGVYRDVNIALVNEFATLADEAGFDVQEAMDVASDMPFVHPFRPGAGVGGHCIPLYPYFLINQFAGETDLIEAARERNDSMPSFIVQKLLEGLDDIEVATSEATIAVLGLTYRPGVPETSHSPSKSVVERLTELVDTVYVIDPLLDDFTAFQDAVPISIDKFHNVDLDGVALVTAHDIFKTIEWSEFEKLAIVDGRNAIGKGETDHWLYTVGKGKR